VVDLLRPPRRVKYQLQERDGGYPPKPDAFLNSLAEWVVFWWLSEGRASRGLTTLRPVVGATQPPVRGRTFFYQIRVPNLGHFQSEVTRVDFLLPSFGDMGYEALAIDPYNTYTHPSVDLDYFKRETLASQARIQLVWIETERLEAGDFDVIEAALVGNDESPRARLGI